MHKRGYLLVALWTKGFAEEMKTHVPTSAGRMEYFAQVDEGETLKDTAQAIEKVTPSKTLAACIAGGEAGVDLADALSEHLGLRTNGTDVPNRRDKKIQQELIRKMGLRSVRQAGGSKFEEVESFLRTDLRHHASGIWEDAPAELPDPIARGWEAMRELAATREPTAATRRISDVV